MVVIVTTTGIANIFLALFVHLAMSQAFYMYPLMNANSVSVTPFYRMQRGWVTCSRLPSKVVPKLGSEPHPSSSRISTPNDCTGSREEPSGFPREHLCTARGPSPRPGGESPFILSMWTGQTRGILANLLPSGVTDFHGEKERQELISQIHKGL